jgi:NADH dehydrogenase FAD-containing subunit
LGSDEPSLDAGHRGIQRCTFHYIFLILENLFSPYLEVVISPKNYFLFTPLLPNVAVGTLNPRSIIQPTRDITRHKSRNVSVIEVEATDVDVSVEQLFANNVDTDVLMPCSQRTRPLPSLVHSRPSHANDTAVTQFDR